MIIIIAFYIFGSEEPNYDDYAQNNDNNSSYSYSSNTQNITNNLSPQIKNASSEKYTVMVYVCGSNLESDGGYATSDIEEMLKSSLADEINLLLYTGGSKKWFGYNISNRTNQIYKVENHKLTLVKDNIGIQNMADSSTLSSFIDFASENYPASKYGLIFWDHGGGALSGFGLDENSKGNRDSLTIDEIKKSVDNSKVKFEFIGFDACLMANVETAYALKDSAKYLIASEETEPGTGWDYITVLNNLSSNTSQDGLTTGKSIVDSFIRINSSFKNPDATLSVIDLSKMDNVYKNLVSFMKDINTTEFANQKYNNMSKAVYRTKAFAEGDLDTFDLIHFANNVNNGSTSSLVQALQEAISYNKTNQYVENSYGLSIYLPNKNLNHYNTMLNIYKNIGMTDEYYNTLTKYVNVMAGGKKESYSVNNYTYSAPTYNFSSLDWFDSLFVKSMKGYYEETALTKEELELTDKGDYYALELSNKDWEKIVNVGQVVWYDDGKGYIDLGVDSYFDTDSDEDLVVSFDGSWIAINGDNVYYEVIERTENYEKGRVPCILNKTQKINLVLYFDKLNPDGVVLGYEPDYVKNNSTLYEKGLHELKNGDTLDFVAPYYTYDGNFKDEYYINDTMTITNNNLKVSYEDLGDGDCLVYYRLKDIYNNDYYTEPVELSE